ncbi:MAG: J domain-containing protein [Hyphomonadaceae bacterium]
MLPVLLIIAGIFAALLLLRVGGAKRALLIQRWPSVLLGLSAGLALARGQVWFALGLAGAAAVAWFFTPPQQPVVRSAGDPGDAEARAILGVGANATAAEIRAAYRAKMAQAHPDRGGSHAEAARLTAARDRLLRR